MALSADVAVRRGDDADELHREWLAPDGTILWVDLVYRLLLGRPAEQDALVGAWRALVMRPGSRRSLVREIVASREFAEAALVEELVGRVASGDDWTTALMGHPDTTERVVEIPWLLGRLRDSHRGTDRVLDLGTRHAFDAYATGLLRLVERGTVVGVDLVMERTRGIAAVASDGCALPFAPGTFGFVSCLSTLEHIGHDNTRYGAAGRRGSARDALRELARVLDNNGRLAVTVPYGRSEHHGWFEQFDEREWRSLVNSAPLEVVEEEVFVLEPGGWAPAPDRSSLGNVGYATRGPAAGAVLCALLRPA